MSDYHSYDIDIQRNVMIKCRFFKLEKNLVINSNIIY